MTADWPYPFWIAHRGAGKRAPENTLAAFRASAALGWRAFECDVKLSADGVPYLLHDDTLERTTSGRGPAAAWSWSALARLDAGGWHSPDHAGEPPPSLEAIAAFVRRQDARLNLEIKPNPGDAGPTGACVADEVLRLWAGADVLPLLTSFQPPALAAVQARAAALPRGLLLETAWPGWRDTATALGCRAVVADHAWIDAGFVQAARSAGLQVLAYTVNQPADAARLMALGLAGLITDAVDRLGPGARSG